MNLPVNRMRAVHPGEILREDYLAPLGMSANALAVALNVPATRIHEIVNERRGISAETFAKIHAKNKERCSRMTVEERRAMFKGSRSSKAEQ